MAPLPSPISLRHRIRLFEFFLGSPSFWQVTPVTFRLDLSRSLFPPFDRNNHGDLFQRPFPLCSHLPFNLVPTLRLNIPCSRPSESYQRVLDHVVRLCIHRPILPFVQSLLDRSPSSRLLLKSFFSMAKRFTTGVFCSSAAVRELPVFVSPGGGTLPFPLFFSQVESPLFSQNVTTNRRRGPPEWSWPAPG